MVISVSTSRGRTGPRNSTPVGRVCPNSTTSPGPDAPRLGDAVPTATVWPNAVTVWSGETRSANAIDAIEMSSRAPVADRNRTSRRATLRSRRPTSG